MDGVTAPEEQPESRKNISRLHKKDLVLSICVSIVTSPYGKDFMA